MKITSANCFADNYTMHKMYRLLSLLVVGYNKCVCLYHSLFIIKCVNKQHFQAISVVYFNKVYTTVERERGRETDPRLGAEM